MPEVFDFCNEDISSFAAGVITLGNTADTGAQTIQSVLSDGEIVIGTVYLDAPNGNVNDWEVSAWTYTAAGTLLTRGTVLSSSNSGAAITVSTTHKVKLSANAFHLSGLRNSWPASGAFTIGTGAGNDTFTGADNTVIGIGAAPNITTSQENVVIGKDAGTGITTSNGYNTYVGKDAGKGATGANNTAIGKDAMGGAGNSTGGTNVVIGSFAGDAMTSGDGNVFIGYNSGTAMTSGRRNVIIGETSGEGVSSLNYSTLIGHRTLGNYSSSIVIGYRASLTATHQCVIGSDHSDGYVTDVYFNGVLDTSPNNIALNAAGASGTNVQGASMTIASGKSTGNAASDNINFQTSDAGASGTTLQSLTTKGYVDGSDGGLVWGSPTGGSQGAGTINAVGVYDDSSLLTDYVFEIYYDGKAIDEGYDNYSIVSLADAITYTKEYKSLPTMPTREEWENNKFSAGELINKLWETAEIQFIYIKELEARLSNLEGK